MVLAGITTFVAPTRWTEGRLPSPALFFAPISAPARAIAAWAHSRVARDLSADQRSAQALARENEELKSDLTSLRVRLDQFARLEEYANEVGDIRPYCTRYSVVGADAGPRATLAIAGSSLVGLADGQFALYPGGVAGRVRRAGALGVHVQLVTDANFRERAGFVRYNGATFTRVTLDALVEGTGRGAMRVITLTRKNVEKAGLKVDDWAVVTEPDWPGYMQGRHLGRVKEIGVRADAPLFAQIIIEPPQNLLRLTRVMIVTREPKREEG